MLCITGNRGWRGRVEEVGKPPPFWKHCTVLRKTGCSLVLSPFTSKLMAMVWSDYLCFIREAPFTKGIVISPLKILLYKEKCCFMYPCFYWHQTISCTPNLHLLLPLCICKVNTAVFYHITMLPRLLLVSFQATISRRELLFKTNI